MKQNRNVVRLTEPQFKQMIAESVKDAINEQKMLNEINTLYESSLNRVTTWIKENDIVTMTAFRHQLADVTNKTFMGKYEEGHVFSLKENRIRNRDLKAKLLSLGYGVTHIYGSWIEGLNGNDSIEVNEESFFVVNLNNDDKFYTNIFQLSEYYNQDSFLYKAKNDDNAYLVGTNNAGFPGYCNKVPTGTLSTLPSKYMSRIKSAALAFVDKNNWIIKNRKSELTNAEMNDSSHSYSWIEDERPTFQNRKNERIAKRRAEEEERKREKEEKKNKLSEDYRRIRENNGIYLETINDYHGNTRNAIEIISRSVKI